MLKLDLTTYPVVKRGTELPDITFLQSEIDSEPIPSMWSPPHNSAIKIRDLVDSRDQNEKISIRNIKSIVDKLYDVDLISSQRFESRR